jgi:dihydropyrimidinase
MFGKYPKIMFFYFYYHFSARIFNIYPKKGAILPGSDADIIILNPNSSFDITAKSHHSRVDTNVYEGRKGKVLV